jgi:predicted RecB family nuclease
MPEPRSGAVLIEPSSSKTYPPESEALEEVPFVGYALAPKLRRMGIKDLGSLAKASPQEIAVGTGIPTSLAATIMTNARKMMGWVSEP